MKKIVTILLMAVSLTTKAQTTDMGHHDMIHISTNLLYDAALVPNIGVEYSFATRWSAKVSGMYAWWSNDSRHRYWRVTGGSLEVRRWLCSTVNAFMLKGHHIGIYAGAYRYDFEPKDKGEMADLNYAIGLTYGYSMPVSRKFSLDFSLGAGYIGGNYTKYTYQDGEYEWLADMKRQYFGLTKAEVSLVYHLELGGKGGR